MERDPMEMALSTDIVMDIVLSHLKVIDLLSCRLTSKFWNKAASSVLRKRMTMIKNISGETCLMELEECMEKSLDFPFTGLKFDEPWALNSGRTTKFFENFGTRFARLCVDAHCTRRLDVMVPFIHHLSQLTVLEMALPNSGPLNPRVKFPDSGAELDGILNLSSLRILRIFCPKVAAKVLGEVLKGTSPSLQIECVSATLQTFEALRKAGKLGAVAFIKFLVDFHSKYYQPKLDQLLSIESPRVTKLDFSHGGCLSLDGLQKILLSSRPTLSELHLLMEYEGMDLVDLWNYFPVLAKLTKLTLYACRQNSFQGRHGHKFPALKEIKLRSSTSLCGGNLADGRFIVPSVTRIDVQGNYFGDQITYLAQVFPNVTDIRLDDYGCHYSPSNPFEIWNVGEFKYLERLRIWNFKVKQRSENPISMDSFLTGMPAWICNNLRKHKVLDMIDSPWNEISRENPSILKLKNLKELIVCLKLEDGLDELPEDPPFMSMVSVWYALEMIPNLQVTFKYEMSLPRSSAEERYKAVLEAALKHVRPYVKLEPFFY